MDKIEELAQGLQNSNISEVSELAKAYLTLRASYDELEFQYVKSYASNKKIDEESFVAWLKKQEELSNEASS
jgi:hypothetical protein